MVRALAPTHYTGKARVLLLAPDPILAKEQLSFLAEYCDVVVAESIDIAVQMLLCDRSYGLVLCPGTLPEGSGNELLRQLIELDLAGCPRVAIFEGSDEPIDVIEALQLGVRQYIAGPCSPYVLAHKVARLLGSLTDR